MDRGTRKARKGKPWEAPSQEDRRKLYEKRQVQQKKRQANKTKSVLARIGRLALAKKDASEWEEEFLGSVSERLQFFGAAFRDPEKGNPGAPLSILQGQKLREIEKKLKNPRKHGTKNTPKSSDSVHFDQATR